MRPELEIILITTQIIESVFTTIAIILGGIWAYFNFFKARIYKPRLEIDISGTPFRIDDMYYLKSKLQLKNVGLSKFVIEQEGTALIVSSFTQPPNSMEVGYLDKGEIGIFSVFELHSWIEPGESIDIQKLIMIPQSDHIALELRLRIVSQMGNVKKRAIEWNETKIIELPQIKLFKEKNDE